jgi:hypothetical protein
MNFTEDVAGAGKTEEAVAAAPVAKAAAWEDCLDIFYAPTQVFARRVDGKVWVPLVVLLSQQVNEAIFDAEFARQMKSGDIPAEAAASAKATAQGLQKFAPLITPIFVVIGSFLTGLAGWLAARFMGAKLTYMQGVTILVLASFPRLIEAATTAAQGLLLSDVTAAHRYSFSLGAARFLGADTNQWLLKLASIANPIAIWETVLIGIGLRVIGKMEKEVAAACAIIITLLVRGVLGWAGARDAVTKTNLRPDAA